MQPVTVIATGIAAHAGNHHEDGANAIWALCRFIARLPAGVRVTSLRGGTSRNTVPDRAEATLAGDLDHDALRALATQNDIRGTTLAILAD
jgi:metal-dependent amidase/aminoacylase/carboxypeptidase family protein